MEEPEPKVPPGQVPDVELLSVIHESVRVGKTVWPPQGLTIRFNKSVGGFRVAKQVPETVAQFLVSIAQEPLEYVIVQPGALPFPEI